MFRPSLSALVPLLTVLFAGVASAETIVNPMVQYSTDFDGRAHYLRITSDSTRVTTPEAVFRVSTRLILEYRCHEAGPIHTGRPLEVTASNFRLPTVDERAAISMESVGNFLADFLGVEAPPFVRTSGTIRLTDLGTGGFVETAATVLREGYGFSRDSTYRTEFDPAAATPERLLRAFSDEHAVRVDIRTPGFELEAVFALTPEEAAPLATLANRCPAPRRQ